MADGLVADPPACKKLRVIRSCSTCEFFSAIDSECHRRAPQMFPLIQPSGQLSWAAGFPPTKPTNWCGEYEKPEDD